MFLQNANKCFFVCATNSRNIILLFPKKVISHDPLQKLYANLARTCKNKFYENKIKLDWLTLFKKFYYGITDRGAKKLPPPCQIELREQCVLTKSLMVIFQELIYRKMGYI